MNENEYADALGFVTSACSHCCLFSGILLALIGHYAPYEWSGDNNRACKFAAAVEREMTFVSFVCPHYVLNAFLFAPTCFTFDSRLLLCLLGKTTTNYQRPLSSRASDMTHTEPP